MGGIEGLRETVKGMEALGVEVTDLKEVFAKIATLGAEFVARHTPTGKTGKLRASVRGNKAKNNAVITAGGARLPYVAAQNYGWGAKHANYKHGRYAGGIKGGYVGSHFMQKGDADMAPLIPDLVNDGLTELIRKNGLQQ